MTEKCIVLDANILVRALFGRKVRGLLKSHSNTVEFYCPDICFPETRKYIPSISAQQRRNPAEGFLFLDELAQVVHPVDHNLYKKHESTARRRIAARDVNDWPVVATALLLNCPIWTEDQDFFGCGIPTWITSNIEVFLQGS